MALVLVSLRARLLVSPATPAPDPLVDPVPAAVFDVVLLDCVADVF